MAEEKPTVIKPAGTTRFRGREDEKKALTLQPVHFALVGVQCNEVPSAGEKLDTFLVSSSFSFEQSFADEKDNRK